MNYALNKKGEILVALSAPPCNTGTSGPCSPGGPVLVQLDDDGFWYRLGIQQVSGLPVAYLSDTQITDDPGVVAMLLHDTDGKWYELRSKLVSGLKVLYILEPGSVDTFIEFWINDDDSTNWHHFRTKDISGLKVAYILTPGTAY